MLFSTALGRVAEASIQHGTTAAAKHLTSTLRQKAHAAGWPADVCLGMSVDHDGSDFVVRHHPATEERAHDLEYGTQRTSPLPVIRPFNSRVDQYANEVLGSALIKKVEEML
jgi:hypothetical protein